MKIARRALLAVPLATPALAQPAWPNRPVRLISPFAPAGRRTCRRATSSNT